MLCALGSGMTLFAWLYCGLKEHLWAAVVLTVSGASDLLDGLIARKCHMESNLGRVLDPVADKLTQADDQYSQQVGTYISSLSRLQQAMTDIAEALRKPDEEKEAQ